ncbi:MAG: hypothetical protein R6V56_04900 [Lentisphaeria bacterium]
MSKTVLISLYLAGAVLILLMLVLFTKPGQVWRSRMNRVYVQGELRKAPEKAPKKGANADRRTLRKEENADTPSEPSEELLPTRPVPPLEQSQAHKPPSEPEKLPLLSGTMTTVEYEMTSDIKTTFFAWRHSASGSVPDISRLYNKIFGFCLGQKSELSPGQGLEVRTLNGRWLKGKLKRASQFLVVLETEEHGEVELLPQEINPKEYERLFAGYASHLQTVAVYDGWLENQLSGGGSLRCNIEFPASEQTEVPDCSLKQIKSSPELESSLAAVRRRVSEWEEQNGKPFAVSFAAVKKGEKCILYVSLNSDTDGYTPWERLRQTAALWRQWAFNCLAQEQVEKLSDAYVALFSGSEVVAGSMSRQGEVFWAKKKGSPQNLLAEDVGLSPPLPGGDLVDLGDLKVEIFPVDAEEEDRSDSQNDRIEDEDAEVVKEDVRVVDEDFVNTLTGRIRKFGNMLLTTGDPVARNKIMLRIVSECALNGAYDTGRETLDNYLRAIADRENLQNLDAAGCKSLVQAISCSDFLAQMQVMGDEIKLTKGFRNWIFKSPVRLGLLVNTLTPQDNWRRCAMIMQILSEHDMEGRDDYYKLILALAVVWDQPRPALHREADKSPPFKPALKERYDYFRQELFENSKAKIPFERLTAQALTYVVDTPVPLNELRWAKENIGGAAPGWDKRYFEVGFDKRRFKEGYREWPYGRYTLAKIAKYGGTGLDRAYYATIAARANGIPAVLFQSRNHQWRRPGWFAYMRGSRRWEMTAGKRSREGDLRGVAVDPQTNRKLVDHQMAIRCEYSLPSKADNVTAADLLRVAKFYAEEGRADEAVQVAQKALRAEPLYLNAYRFLEKQFTYSFLEKQLGASELTGDLLKLLHRQAEVFKGNVAEVYAECILKRADILAEMDKLKKAEDELLYAERVLNRDRADLARKIAMKRLRIKAKKGQDRQTRAAYERFLLNNAGIGGEIISVLKSYVEFTGKSGQTKKAVDFMRPFIKKLEYLKPRAKAACFELLGQAYENAGDANRAQQAREDAERLR